MSDTELVPAECFPVGHYILEEIRARGWSLEEFVYHMGGDSTVSLLTLMILVHLPDDPRCEIDNGTFRAIAKAFGTDEQYWRNLDASFRRWQAVQPVTGGSRE